jgi:hypothetical protein
MFLTQRYYKILILTIILFIGLAGCTSISVFSQYAYQQAVDLKVESLNLISQADHSYKDYQKEVNDLIQKIDKAYEYAKGRKDNDLSTKQWEILINPDGHLFGSFLKKWKSEDKLSSTYLNEKLKQISDAYDEVINLESGKQKQ